MREPDLVSYFVRQVAELYPQMTAAEAMRFEVALRRQWGGRPIYVFKQRREEAHHGAIGKPDGSE